jgi:hypothetical protein
VSGPKFRTITSDDWRRAIKRSRAYKNEVSEQIRAALCPNSKAHNKSMTIYSASQFKPETQGIFTGLPMDVYQKAPGLSKSRGFTLGRSPIDYKRIEVGQLRPAVTEALEHGEIYHSLVFENRRDFHIEPKTYKAPESTKKGAPIIDKPWNNNANACKDWNAKHSDRPILSDYDAGEIERSAKYLRDHPLAGPILAAPGLIEVSFFAVEPKRGILLKGRADKLIPGRSPGVFRAADLKTAKDGTTREFSRVILNRGYHIQAAQYRLILRLLGADLSGFDFIIHEKGPAPKANVRFLSERAMDKGARELEKIFDLYERCRDRGVWPDYHDSEPQIGPIDLPEYAYNDESDVENLEGMTPAEILEA